MVAATEGNMSMVIFETYFSMARKLPATVLMRKL
jgi:hypothetical protein